MNRITLAKFTIHSLVVCLHVSRERPTYAVRLERTPWALSMAYGGFSRSSPAWLGTPRFASLTFASLKIVAFGLGAGEVRLGGKPFSMAWAEGSSQESFVIGRDDDDRMDIALEL